MLAATDAVTIGAILRRSGGPDNLVVLLEGESLLNDASGLTLFKLFLSLVHSIAEHGPAAAQPPLAVAPRLAGNTILLTVGGAATGWLMGSATRHLVRMLRWHGASAAQESAAILSLAYLVYYCADALLGTSGVVAVVVFGLYGNAHAHFDLGSSARMRESQLVQQTVAFAGNGIVFFFAGASCVNFTIRAAETLQAAAWDFALFPAIFAALIAIRGVSLLLLNALFPLLGSHSLPLSAIAFATWSGLRGAVSLGMAQVLVTDDLLARSNRGLVAQMGLWTALCVLGTLLINAPLVPAVLRWSGLVHVSPVSVYALLCGSIAFSPC